MTVRSLFCVLAAVLLASSASAQNFQSLFSFPHLVQEPSEGLIKGSDGNFYGVSTDSGDSSQSGLVFRMSPQGLVTPVYAFAPISRTLTKPVGRLVELGAGQFYGVAQFGGANGSGGVYKVTSDGVQTLLYSFSASSAPQSGLTLAGDGNLYGVSSTGGTNNRGYFYRITPAGAFTQLYSFPATGPGLPYAGLALGADGALYGATVNTGSLFKITTAGTLTTLRTLSSSSDGASVLTTMVFGPDGSLYGTANSGGLSSGGTVFKLTASNTFTVLRNFSTATGATPNGMVLAADGNLYGTCRYGGTDGVGTIFRMSQTGSFTVIYTFSTGVGEGPRSGLVEAGGKLYGIAGLGTTGIAYAYSTNGSFNVLAPYNGLNTGTYPRSALLQASDGNFYGMTYSDGGVIFRYTPGGALSVMHRFTSADGVTPTGALIQASDGHLYGVTSTGGANSHGTIFRMTLTGDYTVLHSFSGTGSIAASGGVVEGKDGRLYGVLSQNGSTSASGSAYAMTKDGTYTVILNFGAATATSGPSGPLLSAPDGNFYGSTTGGGGPDNEGNLFKMTTDGAYTALAPTPYTAYRVQDGLVMGRDGNLYGIVRYVGGDDGGALVRCTPAGVFSLVATLRSASGSKADGPNAGIVVGPDGNFYGTTLHAGSKLGTVYKITPGGVMTVLKTFSTFADGTTPMAGVTVGADGDLYGTTGDGGAGGGGTIFSLDLFPTITTLPPEGSTGSSATLQAQVNPNHEVTTVEFFVDGVSRGTVQVPAGTSPVTVTKAVSGLNPHQSYVARAEATNQFVGPLGGGDVPFSTMNSLPSAGDQVWHALLRLNPSATLDLSARISDPDGDDVVITAVTQPAHGQVTFSGTSVTYSNPDADFTGNDSFTYTVGDAFGGSATGAVTLANAAPTAGNQTLHSGLGAGGNITIDVTALVADADGDTLFVTGVTPGTSAQNLSFAGLTITYTAGPNFTGNDTFSYTIGDGAGGLATGTVTLANAAPTAGDQTLHAGFGAGGSTSIDVSPLVGDANGDTLFITGVTPASFAQNLSFAGLSITYTAGLNFTGNDTFTYTVGDGAGGVATGRITFANQAPVAKGEAYTIGPGTATLDVLANDSDPDGDSLTIASASGALFGTVSTDGHAVTYTPGTSFQGVDVFTYVIRDPAGATSSAQVTIKASNAVDRELAAQGDPIPGLEGATWYRFNTPSLFAEGDQAGWRAIYRTGSVFKTGIFSGSLGLPRLRLSEGDRATGFTGAPLTGVLFRQVESPVFAGDDFAFRGHLRGAGVNTENESGVWVSTGGKLRLVARNFSFAPGTTSGRFRYFSSVNMVSAGTVFFQGWLYPAPDRVNRLNDTGLWSWREQTGTQLVLREGEVVNFGASVHRLFSFRVLPPVAGSPGQGRYDVSTGRLDALLHFYDGKSAIVSIDPSGAIELVRLTGEADASGRTALVLGMPSSCGDGTRPVAAGIFREKGNAFYTAVVDFETGQAVAGQHADTPGIAGGSFRAFKDPVAGLGVNGARTVAFCASVNGAAPAEDTGVWVSQLDGQASLNLLAREGTEPPGWPGAKFQAFDSISILEGRGPVFIARVNPGTNGITARENRGCWAVTSDGSVQLLLREGAEVNGKTLRSFALLDDVLGSRGQRRAFASGDPTPSLIYRAVWTDGSESIVTVAVP